MHLTIYLLLLALPAFAQPALPDFNKERKAISRTGMIVLGAWGVTNVITGVAGQGSTSGSTKYFHRMNLYVGAVNTVLAGVGYLGIRKESDISDVAGTFKKQSSVEKVFLFNTALDIAYVAAGIYLIEKGKTSQNKDRYDGYGKSVIVQGAALFVFDGLMYAIHQRHGKKLLPLLDRITLTGQNASIFLPL